MVLFLCSPEEVKRTSVLCCVLCMCTQHRRSWTLPVDGASWRGGRRFVTGGGVQAWLFTCRWCSQFVFLLVVILILLKVYLCPCVWIRPLVFHVQ